VLDFDQISIVVAVILTAFSLRQFRLINLVMLANFALFNITAHYLIPLLSDKPAMILHAAYVLIGGITVISLVKLKASPPLFITSLLFSVYNLSIVSEFIYFGPLGLHGNFAAVAKAQIIIELLIMFLMSRGGLYVCRGLYTEPNYIHFVDRFFKSGLRMGCQGYT
jgi:hypothetical protein